MKKSVALIGCGKMGLAILNYCISIEDISDISLHDLISSRVEDLEKKIKSIHKTVSVTRFTASKKYDLFILALSGIETKKFVMNYVNSVSSKTEKIFLSLGRPFYDDIAEHERFDTWAKHNNVFLYFGFGLEPGLVELIIKYAIIKHNAYNIHEVIAYCGGLSKAPSPPLYYNLLFGEKLPSDNRRALYKIDNIVKECKRFQMIEKIFIKDIGLVEAYNDGMSPFFLRSCEISAVPNFKQQTIRWPGFSHSVQVLRECGLLSDKIIQGYDLTASDFTHHVLQQNGLIATNVPDVSVINVNLTFRNDLATSSYSLHISSHYDSVFMLSGMAKLTAILTAFTLGYIIKGKITSKPGIVMSHELFKYNDLVNLIELLINEKFDISEAI